MGHASRMPGGGRFPGRFGRRHPPTRQPRAPHNGRAPRRRRHAIVGYASRVPGGGRRNAGYPRRGRCSAGDTTNIQRSTRSQRRRVAQRGMGGQKATFNARRPPSRQARCLPPQPVIDARLGAIAYCEWVCAAVQGSSGTGTGTGMGRGAGGGDTLALRGCERYIPNQYQMSEPVPLPVTYDVEGATAGAGSVRDAR